MAKKKQASQQKSSAQQRTVNKKTDLDYRIKFEPSKKQNIVFYFCIAAIAAVLPVYYIMYSVGMNHFLSFPLDDPWIHLTFAKNLAQYQSFSYFKNEIATAGSTSPVYTFLLAVFFLFTGNEMIMSYVLGIMFFILSAFAFYKLSLFEFNKEAFLALACTALFVIDKWMNFISVSGMETTMYIFILAACAYFYKKRDAAPFAVFAGLALWGRPDSVAFLGALAVDYFLLNSFAKKDKTLALFTKKDLVKIGSIFGGIVLLYFVMNIILSGSLLPNTYNAKLTYYSPEFRSRGDFLKAEVWDYFTAGAYGALMTGFLFGSGKTLFDIFKKKYNPNFLYILFILALVFIYWYKLPYAHRFGRYMMPIIPFFILVSVSGFRDITRLLGSYLKSRQVTIGLSFIIAAILIIMSFVNYSANKVSFSEECKYIYDRQVSAAFWIRDNTKETDIIGTHDVGAIGYYSNRKIVDVAGLITPELITKLHDGNYNQYMTDFMKKSGVTYLAFLRQWYRVVNQNPLFSTAGKLPPEEMEIFKFTDSTYIISADANSMVLYAEDLLGKRMPQQAMQYLSQAASLAPNASLLYYYMAYASSLMGDPINFERYLLKAAEIFPDYKDALLQLGNFYKNNGRVEEAKKYLTRYVELNPDDQKARDMLNSINPVK